MSEGTIRRLGSEAGLAISKAETDAAEGRFWPMVSKSDGCWLWTGSRKGKYGSFHVRGRGMLLAHRVSFAIAFGAAPPGKVVRHNCDTPLCVNPAHLSIGSQRDNKADCISRGRSRGAPGDLNPSRLYPGLHKGSKNGRAELTEDSVREIRMLAGGGMKHRDLAKQFGVGKTTVTMAVRGQTWGHVK